nr:phage terminase large subunit family protein [Streptomyces sp. TRM68367]
MDSEGHVCPACGQPVETVVRRHKTLGAWVPVWVAGPCRNPKCEAYHDGGSEPEEGPGKKGDGKRS